MNLNNFLSIFKGGYASQNRYEVIFNLPKGISTPDKSVSLDTFAGNIRSNDNKLNANQQVSLLCHSLTLPDRNVMTYELRQLNAPFKLPYSLSYMPINFMFYGDSVLTAKKYFDIWQECIINIDSNTINFYNEYTSNIKIYQLDKENKRTYGVELIEAYPNTVSQITYSASAQNQPVDISVVMNYKYWKPINDNRNAALIR